MGLVNKKKPALLSKPSHGIKRLQINLLLINQTECSYWFAWNFVYEVEEAPRSVFW